MSPEPMTRGSSCGTSDKNNASAARPESRAARRPPLMRESAARRALSSPIAMPEENESRVSAARSSGDEEERRYARRQLIHPAEQASARRKRALVGQRMRAQPDFRSGACGEAAEVLALAGDDERALDGVTERLVRAECHGRGRLADRRHPHRCRERLAGERRCDTVTAVHASKARLQELEQQRAARIAGIRPL